VKLLLIGWSWFKWGENLAWYWVSRPDFVVLSVGRLLLSCYCRACEPQNFHLWSSTACLLIKWRDIPKKGPSSILDITPCSPLKINRRFRGACESWRFTLVSSSAYSSTLKMETCATEFRLTFDRLIGVETEKIEIFKEKQLSNQVGMSSKHIVPINTVVSTKLSTTPWRLMGEWRCSSTILNLLTSEVSGQIHSLAALAPEEKKPYNHWIRGWVGLIVSLTVVERRNMSCPCRKFRLVRPAHSFQNGC
jgi:hypothetical protein